MPDPELNPRESDAELLEELVAELLVRMENGGSDVLDTFCLEHPTHEAAVRQRIRGLEKLGLLEFKGTPETASKSLPERIGPYLIHKELGRGGQGIVYLAEEEALSRMVALKAFTPGLLISQDARLRFQREAEAASRLDHPNACTIYGFGEEQGTMYMAMRYVDGQTLSEWLKDLRPPSGVVRHRDRNSGSKSSNTTNAEIPRTLALIEKIARALHAAHEMGLVHRDVKPSNIMIASDGEPVILDFGLVRDMSAEGTALTHTGDIMGTPAYMSPEQVSGHGALDRRTDIYALGAILYECLTLERPFHAPNVAALYRVILATDPVDPRRLNPRITRDAAVVIAKALDKEPARRYQTALELADELRRLRKFEPILARPASLLLRLRRWSQRHPALAATTMGLFLSLSIGLAGSLYLLDRARSAFRRAEGLRLAARSSAMVDEQPDLALLLALEGASLQSGPVANEALLAALIACRQERMLQGPGGNLQQLSVDLQGNHALALSSTGKVRIWHLGTGSILSAGVEEILPVSSAAVLFPNGRFAALGCEDGSLSILDLEAETVQRVEGFGSFRHLLCHPDGMRLLAVFADGSAGWLDLGGQRLGTVREPGNSVLDADISRTGDRLALALTGGMVEIRNAATGTEIARLPSAGGNSVACAFDPTGQRLAVSSMNVGWDDRLRVWDLNSSKILMEKKLNYEALNCLAFSEDGTLLGGDLSGALRRIDAHTGRDLTSLAGHLGPVRSVQLLPGSTRAISGSGDGTLRLWNLGPQPEVTVFRGHEKGVSPAHFGPLGARVLTAGEDGSCRIWDVATGDETLILNNCGEILTYPAVFSPDGLLVACACWDGSVHLNDAYSGQVISSITPHSAPVFGLQFDPRGTFLASASFDTTARIIALDTGEVNHQLEGHTGKINTMRYDSNGQHLLTVSDDGSARLWDADTGEILTIMDGHPGKVLDGHVSPNGKLVLTVCADGCARLFKWGEKQPKWTTPSIQAPLWRAAFSPNGQSFACISMQSSTAYLFNTRDASLVARLEGHESGLVYLAFSPDGRYLATGSLDRTARLWDATNGSPWLTCRGHNGFVTSVEFSPDSRHLITASADGTARLWPVNPQNAAEHQQPRELTGAERERFGLDPEVP